MGPVKGGEANFLWDVPERIPRPVVLGVGAAIASARSLGARSDGIEEGLGIR